MYFYVLSHHKKCFPDKKDDINYRNTPRLLLQKELFMSQNITKTTHTPTHISQENSAKFTAPNNSTSFSKNTDTFSHVDIANSMHLAIVATLLTVMYLIANIMAVKLVNFNGLTYFDAGTIVFPFAYILGDVLTEVWGFKIAKRVIFISFICNILLVFFTNIGVLLPYPEYAQETADAYAHIFTAVPRIVGASLIAFLCGELSNAWTMERIRIATKGKHLWFRAIASSMIGYIFDTVLFVLLAFSGTAPWQDLSSMIFFQYIAKILLEGLIATPFIYILVKYFSKKVTLKHQTEIH